MIFYHLFTFSRMKVLKSTISFSSFWTVLQGDRARKKMGYVVYLMLLPLLLETVITGISDNMEHYFRAPYVKNDFMQSFKQNLPWLPETQQDCFRDKRVTVLQVQTAMVTSSNASQRLDCHNMSGGLCFQSYILLKDLKCPHCCRISSLISSSFDFQLSPIYGLFSIQTEYINVDRPPSAIILSQHCLYYLLEIAYFLMLTIPLSPSKSCLSFKMQSISHLKEISGTYH